MFILSSLQDDRSKLTIAIPDIDAILNKEPDTNDLLLICTDTPLIIDELAQQLGLNPNERKDIRNPPGLSNPPNPLEVAVEKWRQRQSSSVTWKTFRTALENMHRIDLAQKVNTFLRDNFDIYSNKKDFVSYS